MGIGDDIKNAGDKLMGNAKQAFGDATDNDRMQAEGEAQEARGTVGEKVEGAKDFVADKADDLHDRLK